MRHREMTELVGMIKTKSKSEKPPQKDISLWKHFGFNSTNSASFTCAKPHVKHCTHVGCNICAD
jgi:hypothetical protein